MRSVDVNAAGYEYREWDSLSDKAGIGRELTTCEVRPEFSVWIRKINSSAKIVAIGNEAGCCCRPSGLRAHQFARRTRPAGPEFHTSDDRLRPFDAGRGPDCGKRDRWGRPRQTSLQKNLAVSPIGDY